MTKTGYRKYKVHKGENGKKYIIRGKSKQWVYLHTIKHQIKK